MSSERTGVALWWGVAPAVIRRRLGLNPRPHDTTHPIVWDELEVRVPLSRAFAAPSLLSLAPLAATSGFNGGGNTAHVSSVDATRNGALAAAVSATADHQGLGNGSQGGGGPGYPIIPVSGPTLQENVLAPHQLMPAVLPVREPALSLIPTVSRTSDPAPMPATLVALDTTSPAGAEAFASIIAAAPLAPAVSSTQPAPGTGVDTAGPTVAPTSGEGSTLKIGFESGDSRSVFLAGTGDHRSSERTPLLSEELPLAAGPEQSEPVRDGSLPDPADSVGVVLLGAPSPGDDPADGSHAAGDAIDELAKTLTADAATVARRVAPSALSVGLLAVWNRQPIAGRARRQRSGLGSPSTR